MKSCTWLSLAFVVLIALHSRSVTAEEIARGVSQARSEQPADWNLTDWKLEFGKWSVVDGTLLQADPQFDYSIAWLPTRAYADFDMSVDFFVHPDGSGVRAPGLVYHAVDQKTLYYVHFDTKNHNILWVRSTARKRGTDVRRHPCEDLKADQWQTVRVVVQGNQHDIYLNSRKLFSEKDNTLSAGVVGLRTGQGKIAFRNFRIEGKPVELQPPFVFKKPFPRPQPAPLSIVCSDAGAGRYEAFPDVCQTKSGELLCVFYAGYGHVSVPTNALPKGARIAMCRSADEGKTWSKAVTIAETPIDDRDASIIALPNGELLVTFMNYDSKRSEGSHKALMVRSSDNGKTWTKPERISTPFSQLVAMSTPPRLMSDGRLLLTPYGNNTGDPRRYKHVAVLESGDFGRTWTTLAEIKHGKHSLLEPDLIELPDRLLIVMRPAMTWSDSTDGGKTWSQPKDLGISGDCPYLLLTSKNILLCGIRHRPTQSTAVIYSVDFGKTWQGPVPIDNVGGAYPSMIELPDGRIFMVYYTEGKGSDIRCAWLQVDASGVRILNTER